MQKGAHHTVYTEPEGVGEGTVAATLDANVSSLIC